MLAALGLGLVQGFTKNIQEEKAIRASEQQSVDKLNEMIMTAGLTGGKDFSAANAAIIGKAVKAQQAKLDERERIDIFGTPGPRISTDLSSIIPLLQSVDSEDTYTTDFFGMTIPVPEKYSDQEGTNRGDSMLYRALSDYRLKKPNAFQDHFAANPEMFSAAREEMINLGKGTLRFAAQNSTGDTNFTVNTSELPGYKDFFNPFFRISKTQEYNTQWDATKARMMDSGSSIVDNPNLIPLAGSLFTDLKNEKGEPVKTKPTDMIPFVWDELDGMDEDRWNSVGQIASLQGKDTSQFIYDFSSGFEDLQSFSDGLIVATDLAALGAAKGNKRTGQDILMQGEYIYKSPLLKDDVFAQANVFMAFQPMSMGKNEQDMIDAGITPEVTVGKGEAFKAQFENLVGITYAKFQTKMSGVTGAQSKLKRYRDLIDQLPTNEGVLKEVVRIVTSIFGETGKIDQIVDIMGLSEDEYEGSGIAEFIEKDQRKLAKKRGKTFDIAETIAASDALAYIIAADLARAEDDQGRLSDADIERNLNKLRGFGATTKDGQLRAIEEVMRTIDSQNRSLSTIDRISENGMATGVISRDDRRLLAADKQARKARQMYLNSIAGMRPDEEAAQASVSAEMLAKEFATATVNGVDYYQIGSNQFATMNEAGETAVITEDEFVAAVQQSRSATTAPAAPEAAAPEAAAPEAAAPEAAAPEAAVDMSLKADEAGVPAGGAEVDLGTRKTRDAFYDVIPLRKFANAGKQFSPSSDTTIVSFYDLTNSDGTPRMFKKVFDQNNKLIGYREMTT
jgi:hypothetical protein